MLRHLLLVLLFSFCTFASVPPQITYNENNQPLVVEYEDGDTITYSYDGVGKVV